MTKNSKNPSIKNYSKLLGDIEVLIKNGQKEIEKANQTLAKIYWQIGKRILDDELTKDPSYRNIIVQNITSELELEKTILLRCINFYQTYPILPNFNNLTWSHYKQLIAVKDEEVRRDLEEKIEEESWSNAKLTSAIKEIQKPTPIKKLKRPSEVDYLYAAKVKDVIDGDTLLLDIDLGFGVWKEQRLRLAEIDCPEISTKEGKESKHFTLVKLAAAEAIVIQTKKIDIYGRYLAHLFYGFDKNHSITKVFLEGNYLNDEILVGGMGVRF